MRYRKRISLIVALLLSLSFVIALFAACNPNEDDEDDEILTSPVASLTVVSNPTKTAYEQGEHFDKTGLVINATLEDETVKENVKYTIQPDRPLKRTDVNVIAKYGGKQIAIPITVAFRGNNDRYSVANTETIPNSPLAGKTYFFLGSSVTYGASSGQQSMADFIAKRNDCTTIKQAVSGTTLADNGAANSRSYVARLTGYTQDSTKVTTLDAFICQLSTNDAAKPQNFGAVTANNIKDISQFDQTTTFGAIEYIIALVKQVWDCPIVFYTNSYYDNENYAQMVEALHVIEAKWGITVIDLYNDTEFNAISADDLELYMADEIHPTKAGYRDWWTPKFEEALKSLL